MAKRQQTWERAARKRKAKQAKSAKARSVKAEAKALAKPSDRPAEE